jgi:hypothetical protein
MRYGIGSENRCARRAASASASSRRPPRVLLQLAGELAVCGPVQRALDVTLAE